jgi:hypothetical protein
MPTPEKKPWEGFGWSATTSFKVPGTWPTGLYRLADGTADVFTFVVRPERSGATSKVLLHVPFLTATAYNNAGPEHGRKSLYGYNSDPDGTEASRATQVSLDRPGSTPGSSAGEAGLIWWLEIEKVPIEYCSSVDLHTIPNLLADYECLILVGHDEYWTKQMRDAVERFIANGGNLIVLSGNTCYRAVRLERNNRLVVFHKYASSDPNRNSDEATVAWAEPPLNRPQNSMLGVGFTEGAYGGNGTAYTIRFPAHWVFAGVTAGTTSAFMHYEADAAQYVEDPEGYPRVTGAENTPLNFTVLASADLRSWTGKPGRATMGIYSRNGTVFNASTTDWIEALGSDPVVNQITRNVVSRLKQRVPWDWENIGHANGGTALASLQGKLFISTTDNRLWRRYPVGAEINWRHIGHANDVIAMAGIEDVLFCVTRDDQLWYRAPVEIDTDWIFAGKAPTGTKALAAAGGMLYVVDTLGKVWRTPARRIVPSWNEMTSSLTDPTINAMTSYSDILIASTTDNRLLRSNRDFISESTAWTQIHHCNFSVGLAVVEWMLYVATRENLLWKLDLHGLRQPYGAWQSILIGL